MQEETSHQSTRLDDFLDSLAFWGGIGFSAAAFWALIFGMLLMDSYENTGRIFERQKDEAIGFLIVGYVSAGLALMVVLILIINNLIKRRTDGKHE